VHRTILVVDVEGFGDRRRTNPNQVAVRDGMYRSLQWAFSAADIPWDDCNREDRGDGVFILAAPEVHKAAFVELLPPALVTALQRHNATHPSEEQIRLRMALHAGEINYDAYGVTAASINHAFRLVDAPILKKALAESPGVLAIIVSSWFFEEVVRHSLVEDAAMYHQTKVEVKETTASAWICVPDYPYAPDETIAGPGRTSAPTPRQLPVTQVPQQLPARPRSFTGRTRELAELTSSSDVEVERNGAMTIVVIAGMGGIGKTWLALQWAHENADRFPDGQMYVNLRGFDPSDAPVAPAVAVRGFLDALRLPPGSLPVDPDAQAALYRSLVSGRRMLILLDNARESGQVAPLLPGSPTCTVLITSRHQLTGLVTAHEAWPVALDVLNDVEARELLAKRLGQDRLHAEPLAVDKLVGCCAGLPLALGIVAAHAATHADFPLAVLASELGEASARLDILDGGELTANLRAVLSWSYQALDRDAADVFRLLGLAPGPDIDVPAAAVLTDRSLNRTVVLLRQLENAHLVQRHSPTRYRMHDLIRLYAAERAAADDGVRDDGVAALRRLLSYYVHATYVGERLLYPHRKAVEIGEPPAKYPIPSFADDTSILKWFDVEHACLLAAQAAAVKMGWHEFVWQLAWTLHGYLWRRGHLHEQLATWTAGLAAAQELGDPALEGVAHRLLGQAHARAGTHTTASYHLHRALDLAKETGDTHGEARAYYDLTWVWRQTDDQLALNHAKKALGLFQTLDSPVWEAEALNMMGWHQAQLGQYEAARSSCERALVLFRQERNRQGQAVTLDSLGYISYHRGEHDQALKCFRESLDLCRDLGATYYEADTLDHLGLAHAALGQGTDARVAWQQALRLNRAQHRTADAHRVEQQLVNLDRDASPSPQR
jgi:tetratricopeptide (TPR) repeat protein